MIESYQQEMSEKPEETQPYVFATIGEVYDDGVSLIFPGETEPGKKHYKVNTLGVYSSGQRVKVIKDSGTYIVEYPVGNPKKNSSEVLNAEKASKIKNQLYSTWDIEFSTQGSTGLQYRINNGSWHKLAEE